MKTLIVVSLLFAGRAFAQDPAPVAVAPEAPRSRGVVVTGRVVSASGTPVRDAHVELVELGLRRETDADGRFTFEAVPSGSYLLHAESPRAGLSVARVDVATGGPATFEVTLDRALHREDIVVTATAGASALSEIMQPVSVLSGAELMARRQPTLGETLAQEPGVSSTYFGPGASRPVIRGLGGDRIRILQNGVGTADASNTSPDHAVSLDPLIAEQIEVVRGPATLLYGSNAVGGVVNVLDDRVPDTAPDRPLHGRAEAAVASAAEEASGALSLDGGASRFAWHADFLKRKTDDVRIPGFAESAALRAEEEEEGGEHEQATGVLENSAIDNTSGAIGASLVGSRGFLGVAVSGVDSLYGVPGHHEEAEGEEAGGGEEEESVRVDLRQRRADLRGELRQGIRGVRNVRLRLGVADYEHTELEGGAIGTVFNNDSGEGRLEVNHEKAGPFLGTVGVQAATRDFEAIGEEAFVPPTTTDTFAVFAFEEARRGRWQFQAGGRFEHQAVEARGDEAADRSFDAVSASGGLAFRPSEGWTLSATVARSVKLPNAEELFSNGPHIATRAFEIGDPDLGKEKSLGVDVSLRRRTGRVTGAVNLFMNRFDGYIFEEFTGEEEDGLQVVQYVQRDADFRGAEA